MTSRRRGPPNVTRSMGFENGDAAIMPAEHHSGGSELLCDTAHNSGRTPKPKAKTANLGRTQST
jgi:hypothetical protein